MNTKPWYAEYFGEDYLRLYMPAVPPERTRAQIDDIIRHLNLSPGANILDLCCGYGRHAIEVAQRGYEVTGFDLSDTLLQRAKTEAGLVGATVRWVQGDMRELPFDAEFDAVINLFSSFGYLESDEEDQRVLQQVSNTLKPGGLFLQEIGNRESLVRTFQPASVTRLPDDLIVVDERELNLLTSQMHVHTTLLPLNRQRTSMDYYLRLYSLTEITKMVQMAGLVPEQYFGNLGGAELTLDSTFLVTLCRKPLANKA